MGAYTTMYTKNKGS